MKTIKNKDQFLPFKCKLLNICFVGSSDKYSKFLSRDAGICHLEKGKLICPTPIDPVPMNMYCKSCLLVAMKVIYLCKLERLIPLLEDQDINVKVVHLVRDPRSTINSRMGHQGKINKLEYFFKIIFVVYRRK